MAATYAATEDAASRRQRPLKPVRPAVQERDLAHVVLAEHLHQQARQPEAEAAVRRRAVAEEVQVVCDRAGVDALVRGLGEQHVVAVLALGAGRELDAPPEQVEAARQSRIVGVAHVVEGPHRRGVVGDERELVAVLGGHQRRQRALARRVEVVVGAGDGLVAGRRAASPSRPRG